eukprot:INCI20286.1.p1 GENE.INCI20286.1~~INCI20286.1.p1  ORF type:complete len:867 (+),score=142.61 INCI20286.1:564-3164(+)
MSSVGTVNMAGAGTSGGAKIPMGATSNTSSSNAASTTMISGMRAVPATIIKPAPSAPASAPRPPPKRSHVVVPATIIRPAPSIRPGMPTNAAAAAAANAARVAQMKKAGASGGAGTMGGRPGMGMKNSHYMHHGSVKPKSGDAKKKQAMELAKSLGFPMPHNTKKKTKSKSHWSDSKGKSGKKKKKKGDGGSDDGSSSDEEADPLRKKIKWNMEPHLSIMRKAVEAALTGKSTTKIADEYSIPARTLRRYVANEKRDADRPKLLKTVDLGLSGLAKQQRMKAAAAAAAAAAAGGKSSSGKSTPRKGGSTSSHQGKGSKFTSKHMKTMTKNMKKHAMDKKKKQAQTTAASTSAVKKKPNSTTPASGSAIHHQMMMNFHHPPPSMLGVERPGSNGRMRANSFEMLLKAYEFEYMMNNNNSASGAAGSKPGTTSNTSTPAANTAGQPTSATGGYDRHLLQPNTTGASASLLGADTGMGVGDPSWPRRRTRTNSLDLLLNAAKLDSSAPVPAPTTASSMKPVTLGKANSMMLAPAGALAAGSKLKTAGSDSKLKSNAGSAPATRLPSASIGAVEDLAVAAGGGAPITVEGHPHSSKDSLLRDRMSSFDADSLWARTRSMSGSNPLGGVPGDVMGGVGGVLGGLRDRRASSMDMYDPFMAAVGGAEPPRRNRFESGSLDLLMQVCEDNGSAGGVGKGGVGGLGAPGARSHGVSLGSMSFGSMGELGAMSFGDASSRRSSMSKPWQPSTAPMQMGFMEAHSGGPGAGLPPSSTKGKGKGKAKTNAAKGKGKGKATKRKAPSDNGKSKKGKQSATSTYAAASLAGSPNKKSNLKFTLDSGKGKKKKAATPKGSKRGGAAASSGHALDVGGWKR